MSRTLREPHRIYIESDYNGMLIGYITVKEGTAEFTAKTTVVNRHSHGSDTTFQSFHKNDVYFYKQLFQDARHTGLVLTDSSSFVDYTRLEYPRRLCIDHDQNGSKLAVIKHIPNRSIKTISIFYDGYWYMPVIDMTNNEYECGGNSSCHAKEHMLLIYYSPASNSENYGTAMDYHCVGRQKKGYSTNSTLFEFGEGKGEIIVFSVASDDHDFNDQKSYIEYNIFKCSSGSCSNDRRSLLSINSSDYRGYFTNTLLYRAKKDSGNPYVFYLKFKVNGTVYNRQYAFNRDGTIKYDFEITDSFGFSMPIGTTTHPTLGHTYNLFFTGYFDNNTNRFKVGFNAENTIYTNNDGDVFFRFNEGSYSYYYPYQYKGLIMMGVDLDTSLISTVMLMEKNLG